MMADAEEGSLGAVDHDLFNADDDCDDVYIDLDSFWRVMGGASTDQVIFRCIFLCFSGRFRLV